MLLLLGILRRLWTRSSGRGGGVSARGVILRFPCGRCGELGSGLNRSSVLGTVRFVCEVVVSICAAIGLLGE